MPIQVATIRLALLSLALTFCGPVLARGPPILAERLGAKDPSGDLLMYSWSAVHNWDVDNVSQIAGRKVAGAATSWQTPNGPFNVEHLAAISPAGDLLVFFWSPEHDWQAVNVSQKTNQKIAGAEPPTSWQTPNGPFNVEHVAAISPAGDLLVFFWSPQHDWQMVNASNIAVHSKIGSAITSWQVHLVAPLYDVLTQHNDNNRSGAFVTETELSPATVRPGRFGRLYSRTVEGNILAQPLYVRRVHTVRSGIRNLFFVATATNMVYAFDADETSADPAAGLVFSRRLQPTGNVGICPETIPPVVGITSTPVIDPNTNTMYVVARNAIDGQNYLHALDITDDLKDRIGATRIVATDPQNSQIRFNSTCQRNRPGLLLLNGVVYIAFGTFTCDASCSADPYRPQTSSEAYHGWVLGYKATDLTQVAVYDTSSDGGGAGIWQSGNGLAADNEAIYLETGNDLQPDRLPASLGDSFVKLRVTAGFPGLIVGGEFRPSNADRLGVTDTDLGSGGPLLLPAGRLIGGGKEGKFYVIDRNTMALVQNPAVGGSDQFQAFLNTYHHDPNQPSFPNPMCPDVNHLVGSSCYVDPSRYQDDEHFGPNIHGGPVYWRGPDVTHTVIFAIAEKDSLKAFRYDLNGGFVPNTPSVTNSPLGRSPDGMPGGFISLSANGNRDGVIWASIPNGDGQWANVTGRIVAFDATDLNRVLWSDEDQISFAKFTPPTIADGKVYRATFANQVIIYGLLPSAIGPTAAPQPTAVVASSPTPCYSIDQKYQNFGGVYGILGSPITSEMPIGDSVGGRSREYRASLFLHQLNMLSMRVPEGGEHPTCAHPERGTKKAVDSSIYWSPNTCAHVIQGGIRDLWRKIGAQGSQLGYPISDEMSTPDHRGRKTIFQGGVIVWYPGKGAFVQH